MSRAFSLRATKTQVARSVTFASDLWIEGEVEVVEGLLMLEAGASHALLELPGVAPFDFVEQERKRKSECASCRRRPDAYAAPAY